MHVYNYVFVRVYNVCVYNVCVYLYMYIYVCVYIYVDVCVFMFVYTCVRVCTCVCVCMCTCTFVHACTRCMYKTYHNIVTFRYVPFQRNKRFSIQRDGLVFARWAEYVENSGIPVSY